MYSSYHNNRRIMITNTGMVWPPLVRDLMSNQTVQSCEQHTVVIKKSPILTYHLVIKHDDLQYDV